MTTDNIKQLGAEFHRAADSLADTLARLDNARLDRLAFLRRCSKDSAAGLAALKEEVRWLREHIAKWDAEAARLESQTAEDLLRWALEPKGGDPHALELESRGQVMSPSVGKAEGEPYRAGLPPERLRKVWAEWKDEEGDILKFSHDGQEFDWIRLSGEQFAPADAQWAPATELDSAERYRPHGATWARVEAMADEAEKPTLLDLRTVRLAEDHADPDWVVADADLFDIDESSQSVEKGQRFQVERVAAQHHGAPRVKIHVGGNQVFIGALQPAHVEPRTPELLNLCTLKIGTVCEATGQIARGSHVILPGERFAFAGSSTEFLARVRVIERDESFDVPTMVHARVVKEGGEQ